MTELDQILPAVAKAMGAVKRIAKDSRNLEQKYDFASVDDFLALVNPICADAGLVFHMNETGLAEFTRQGKYGETHWLRLAFAITVYHASGQSLPPVTRSVEVIRSGAQAYGSAQSYALKQFLRALLLIPTGDKDDADFQAQGDGKPEPAKKAPPTKPNPAAEGLKDAWEAGVLDLLPENASPRMKAEAFALAICTEFAVKNIKALNNAWDNRGVIIKGLAAKHPDLFDMVTDAYENRKNELTDGTQEIAAE